MSENNNKEQSHGGQSAPRVARSASSQPLIGKEQIQTHEGVSAAPTSGVKVRDKVARRSAPRVKLWWGRSGKVCSPTPPPVPVV